jgi:alpha-galactosidase
MNSKTFSCIVAVAWVLSSQSTRAASPTPGEMAEARRWAVASFEDAGESQPFFSFTYGGKPSAEFLSKWDLKRASRPLDEKRTEHTLTYSDPATGLVVRCVGVEGRQFPTVEWTLYFKNTGSQNTPIISDLQALDSIVAPKTGDVLLHHFRGDDYTKRSFEPFETPLAAGIDRRFAPAGGRPSNGEWPYYNLQWQGGGMMLAIGWPGQWACRFTRQKQAGVRIRAGQELTHFTLHPGEEVRTPLIVLMFYQGDWIDGQNRWRRWMLAENFPKDHGKPLSPKIAGSDCDYFPGLRSDYKGEMAYLSRYPQEGVKLDYWWIDAGWYPCPSDWGQTGTWEVDRGRFPGGLRAIADHLHANGQQFILWFEPERVTPNTWLTNHHPDWVLGGKNGGLLNLGNPEAWSWLVDRIDKLITSEGVDVYRQDFNMDPLGYWRGNDAADRQGITEIKHVTGYLAYWDELRRRHPGMLIDSCASGGRRDDFETMRRAVPFLRSDYCTDPDGMQCHTYGFALWLPYYRGATAKTETYDLRSNYSPLMLLCWDTVRNKNLDYTLAKKLLAEWRQVAPCFFGDFYPLTSYHATNDHWMAWQFDCPERGEGMVQAFRRGDSPYEALRPKLRGLDQNATYTLTNLDRGDKREATGRQLTEQGLSVAIDSRPGSAIIVYKKRP